MLLKTTASGALTARPELAHAKTFTASQQLAEQ